MESILSLFATVQQAINTIQLSQAPVVQSKPALKKRSKKVSMNDAVTVKSEPTIPIDTPQMTPKSEPHSPKTEDIYLKYQIKECKIRLIDIKHKFLEIHKQAPKTKLFMAKRTAPSLCPASLPPRKKMRLDTSPVHEYAGHREISCWDSITSRRKVKQECSESIKQTTFF